MSASVAAHDEVSLPTARDVPLGPLAGMDVPLRQGATGPVLHLSEACGAFRMHPGYVQAGGCGRPGRWRRCGGGSPWPRRTGRELREATFSKSPQP